jgi:NADH:ubiquinone oxidoreductase subunit 3 (subunit A)
MRAKLLFIIFSLIPGALFPCAVCYGNPEAPMTHGMNMGVLTLLGFIIFILLVVAYSIFTISMRAKKINNI